MKNLLKLFLGVGIAFTLASCGAMNEPYGNTYPNQYPQSRYPNQYPNEGVVYRAPDGGIFRQGEIYRDRNGNVYQNGRVIRTGDVYGKPGVLDRNGRVLFPGTNPRKLPPGQAKKVYGGNATDYAHGQMKKRNAQQGAWRNDDRRWKDDDRKWKDDNRKWKDDDDDDDDRYKKGKGKNYNNKYKNKKK